MDIVLGKEPWLNAITACPFKFGSDKGMEENDTDARTWPSTTEPTPEGYRFKDVNKFIGQYGSFAHGNLTITVNDTSEELIVNFDVYSCVVKNVTEKSEGCHGLDLFWFLSLWRVKFDEKNSPCQFVDVTFDKKEDTVRFERDLLFADAPGPRDHWPQCEDVCHSKASQKHELSDLLIVILSLVTWKLI